MKALRQLLVPELMPVYVGGPAFGARAYAQNFTQEELITAIETAHIHNRKLYLLL